MGSSPLPADSSVNTFSVQAFTDLNAVSWDRSSALTKLLTIATVCNKAKFTFAEEGSSAGENVFAIDGIVLLKMTIIMRIGCLAHHVQPS
jgi:hypothetical protein